MTDAEVTRTIAEWMAFTCGKDNIYLGGHRKTFTPLTDDAQAAAVRREWVKQNPDAIYPLILTYTGKAVLAEAIGYRQPGDRFAGQAKGTEAQASMRAIALAIKAKEESDD